MSILTDPRVIDLKYHTESISHGSTNLFNHLLGTYNILKNKNLPEYLCLAGLFHSVYETEYVSFNTIYTRPQMKSMIGEEAENLVYIFCNLTPRINLLIAKSGNWNSQVYADLLDIELANMAEQQYYNEAIKILQAIRFSIKV